MGFVLFYVFEKKKSFVYSLYVYVSVGLVCLSHILRRPILFLHNRAIKILARQMVGLFVQIVIWHRNLWRLKFHKLFYRKRVAKQLWISHIINRSSKFWEMENWVN